MTSNTFVQNCLYCLMVAVFVCISSVSLYAKSDLINKSVLKQAPVLNKSKFSGNSKINVTFMSVASKNEVFWGNMTGMAKAAAKDLNIDLNVVYSNRNHIKAIELLKGVVSQPDKPDYLIVVGEKNIGSKSIVIADEAGVATVLFGSLTDAEKGVVLSPREKYDHWIGSRGIDDFRGGYLVAQSIIEKAKLENLYHTDGKIYLVAIAGVYATSFNKERLKGLEQALKEHPEVVLLQTVPAYWMRDKAKFVTKGLLDRYHKTMGIKIGAIWTANTDMALGCIEAVKEYNIQPGKDVFISGIDYSKEGVEAVLSGELISVVGGHFADIAWILVLIYDYAHGHDFIREESLSTLFTLNKDNAVLYMKYFENKDRDQIDFSKFSKALNPKLKSYNFLFKSILKQLEEK